jgi:hypothetical protein
VSTALTVEEFERRREEQRAARTSRRPDHHCGWAKGAVGVWRCLQDYYAVGHRPDTSCGAVWTDPLKETTE